MRTWIKDHRIETFFVLLVFEAFAMNYAHPITPTLLKELNMPSYMFGYAYAAMAFTNFLFSPFWGNISSKIGSKLTLSICSAGYLVGQVLFAISSSVSMILVARVVSGMFVGGLNVAFLTYIINFSKSETRGQNLTILVTIQAVSNAFGYLIGGVLGDISIPLTFGVQVVQLFILSLLFYFLLGEDKEKGGRIQIMEIVKEVNPIKAFERVAPFLSKLLVTLLLIVFITSVATTAYDQCFNYFIKDQYNFPPSYNGILKAVLGMITLLANSFISIRMIRSKKVASSLVFVLFGCALTMLGITIFSDLTTFIIINVIFFVFNAIYLPLLQDLVANSTKKEHIGKIVGVYNAMKSLGMVVGALFAGSIYGYGAKLSFAYACLFFFIGMLLTFYYMKKRKSAIA